MLNDVIAFTDTPVEILTPLKLIRSPVVTERVTLSCQLSKQITRCVWSKDGDPIRNCDKFRMTFVGHSHNLLINDFDIEDEGLYSLSVDDLNTSYYVVKDGL